MFILGGNGPGNMLGLAGMPVWLSHQAVGDDTGDSRPKITAHQMQAQIYACCTPCRRQYCSIVSV